VIAGALVLASLAIGLVGVLIQAGIAARERDLARGAERRASAINDFVLRELLESPTPERALGRPLTVAEVLDGLAKRPRPAFNTVQTTLRILEQKGYVRHDEVGRGFVYHPVVDKASVSKAAVKQLLTRFFNDSAGQLAVNLLSEAELSNDEITKVERMIAEAKRR